MALWDPDRASMGASFRAVDYQRQRYQHPEAKGKKDPALHRNGSAGSSAQFLLKERNERPCPRARRSTFVRRLLRLRGRQRQDVYPPGRLLNNPTHNYRHFAKQPYLSIGSSHGDVIRSMVSAIPVSWTWMMSWVVWKIVTRNSEIIIPSPRPVCGRHRATNGVVRALRVTIREGRLAAVVGPVPA